jgi:hypothetical protein
MKIRDLFFVSIVIFLQLIAVSFVNNVSADRNDYTLAYESGYLYESNCGGSYTLSYNNYSVFIGSTTSGSGREHQGFLMYDTEDLPDDATIDSANWYYWLDTVTLDGAEIVELYECDYGPTLTTADWDITLGENYGTVASNGDSTDTWYDQVVNASKINVTGNTTYCLVARWCRDEQDYAQFGQWSPRLPMGYLNVTFTPVVTDTCTYGGSGDWYVKADDNCVLSSNTVVSGTFYLSEGPGNFTLSGASLAVQDFKMNASASKFYMAASSKLNITG